MSLLDAFIQPHEALIAVDTIGMGRDGTRLPSSKLLPIPHLNAAIAIRGQLATLGFTFLRCVSAGLVTFDGLIDALPEILINTEADTPADLIVETGGAILGTELVVAGYSQRHGSMAGRLFYKLGEMTEYATAEFGFFLSPQQGLEDVQKTPAALERIARAQVKWMRASFPNAACGGKLLVCRLTRKSVTLEHRLTFNQE